ncbi:putative rrna-processing protein efg1 protein [Neofusicoccum parvum UCRNP2]|uniref:rRNA-processing protein EFG1 n=2 Tax=Neofusicoccum parvum TaxID=310453 RepID=R1GHJ5_BOTPV|nr:putative rrna-processing protein efg1 protein [Neofusicoccum parvum UCRNP2]GME23980.1 rrna-processing protein efg1 [Neofusicoccum parvum]
MTAAKRKTDGYAPHAKKQRTGAQNHPKYQPKKFSLNPLKARIRDLRRQLSRTGDDMPANIRVDKERELQACEHELSVAEAERIKQDMIPRYHKVRFFERQKATRFLKKAVKRLNDNSDPEKHTELEREKHVAEVDLNYTLYYPLIRPYVSLYATSKVKDDQSGSANTTRIGGDKEMWDMVENKMQDNTLEALRNGLEWRQGASAATPTAAPMEKKSKKPHTTKSTASGAKSVSTSAKEEESGDDSDGGFFE